MRLHGNSYVHISNLGSQRCLLEITSANKFLLPTFVLVFASFQSNTLLIKFANSHMMKHKVLTDWLKGCVGFFGFFGQLAHIEALDPCGIAPAQSWFTGEAAQKHHPEANAINLGPTLWERFGSRSQWG